MIGKKRVFFTLLLLLPFFPLSSARVWAQGEGGGEEGSSGGSTSSGETSGRLQSSGPPQSDRQRPMFLSGRVLLDDGQPPESGTKVDLTCRGSVVQQDYTSHTGTFSMEIAGGQQGTRPMDASISSSSYSQLGGGFGSSPFGSGGFSGSSGGSASSRSIDLSTCELQARLPGYQSEVISLGRRRALDNPDVGLIILHSMKPPEIGTVSLKTLAAPKDSLKAYEKAAKELQKETPNFSKASKELAKAVEIYPEFASAWQILGEVHLAQNDRPAASQAFEEAKAADSEYANPYLSLALMALEDKQWQEAADLCSQALELNPRLTKAHYYSSLANSSLGRLKIAEESALLVLDSNQAQTYPLIYYVLGFAEAQKENFSSAAARYRSFLEILPDDLLAGRLREQMAQWQEQGLIK